MGLISRVSSRTYRKNSIMYNILITGTPGTGKTTMAAEVAQRLGITHVNIGEIAKENNYYDGYDEALQSHILDEDKLLDDLELRLGDERLDSNICDYHSSEMFPERWFDLVVVLRCPSDILFKRLETRNYSQHKIQQNVEAEIFQTILDEAKDSYKPEIVQEVNNATVEDMEENIEKIIEWVKN